MSKLESDQEQIQTKEAVEPDFDLSKIELQHGLSSDSKRGFWFSVKLGPLKNQIDDLISLEEGMRLLLKVDFDVSTAIVSRASEGNEARVEAQLKKDLDTLYNLDFPELIATTRNIKEDLENLLGDKGKDRDFIESVMAHLVTTRSVVRLADNLRQTLEECNEYGGYDRKFGIGWNNARRDLKINGPLERDLIFLARLYPDGDMSFIRNADQLLNCLNRILEF